MKLSAAETITKIYS